MVVHAYYPLAEPRVQREAAAARNAGFTVTVLALRAPGEAREETVDHVRVRRLRIRHRRGAGFARMVVEYLSFCALATWWLAIRSAQFDIVHFHSPPDFLIIAGLIPRLRGRRLILDIHDLSPHMFAARVSAGRARLVSRLLVGIERLACAAANDVVTVHSPYRCELVRHGVPTKKVHVVMNGVDEAVLAGARLAPPVKERSAAFVLAYHGTLTWWYGVDLIVDAVWILRGQGWDVEAVIIGAGDALPSLQQQVADRGLEQYVTLSGRYVPIEEALATVATADCGIVPNRPSELNRFALSSKLFEYVALGVPAVVSRLDTLIAHFSPQEVTFFDPGHAAALAAAVRWVGEHRDEAQVKVGAAQRRADSYSWHRGREELMRVYRGTAANGQPIPTT